MKQKISTTILVLILILSSTALVYLMSLGIISTMLGMIIGFMLLLFVNRIEHYNLSIYKKNKMFYIKPIVIHSIVNLIICSLMQLKSINYNIAILIVIQVISNVGIYKFFSKEYNSENAIISLIPMTIINMLTMTVLNKELVISELILSIILYSITEIDQTAYYRKKNYIIAIIIGFMLGLIKNSLPTLIVYIILVIMLLGRKIGRKKSVKLGIFLILAYVITTLININLIATNKEYLLSKNITILLMTSLITIELVTEVILAIKKKTTGNTYKILIIMTIISLVLLNSNNALLYLYIYIILITTSSQQVPLLRKKKIKTRKVSNSYTISDETKKVTAVIPNYNYENYILERIDSVLFQTYKVSELIILDDVSKDNSVEVIEKKVEEIKQDYKDLSVKFIKNKKNSGNVFKQWAKSFEVANNEYIWICEADDSASPYFLENVMKGFNDDEVYVSYAESLTMDENDNLLMPNLREWIDIYGTGKWNKSYIIPGRKELEETLCINNTIANVSSVVFKRHKDINYLKLLKTAEEFKLAGDWYFYAKVLEYGKIAYCKKSLNYHRMHSKSVTLTTKNDLHYKEICRIQDMILNEQNISGETKRLVFDRRENTRLGFNLSEEELRLLDIPIETLDNSNNDEVLLSIIVPVYNTELYVEKCLNSVLEKLPPKTEILVINDGSPDHSDKIIEKFEKKYKGIVKQYKKENGGLSSAKNYGLSKAKGKYIIYLDSDDYVSPNMYITMLKKAIETDADIVYCDIFEEFEDGRKVFFSMSNYDYDDEIMRISDTPMMAASWNKMIKKKLFKNIKYPEGFNNEDVAISPILFVRAKKIEKISSPFYNYLQRTGSIQNSGFSEKRFVIFDTTKMCYNSLKKEKTKYLDFIYGTICFHQILGLLLYVISKIEGKERLRYIKMFCDKMNKLPDLSNNEYYIKYIKMYKLEKLQEYISKEKITKINRYLIINNLLTKD